MVVIFTGHRIRTRDIIVQPDLNGQQCSHLAEFVPCDIHICYEWTTEPIDSCVIENGDPCGEGTQLNKVTCLGPDKVGRKHDLGWYYTT